MCAIFGGFELSSHTERDYLIWNEQAVKDYDKYELSKEIVQTNYADGIQPLRTSRMSNWYTSVTFQCSKCDTILTADYVNEMYQIEQLIVNHNNYVSFCQATSSSDSSCASDAYESFSKQFSGTATQTAIDTLLSSITTSSYDTNKLFLSTSFTQSNTKSTIARANFNFASPIEIDGKRYKTFIDDEDGQDDKMVDFSEDLNKLINKFNTTLKVQLYNSVFYDSEVDKYVQEDFGLAVASFTFVLIYVSFHLKSVFLGGFAMLAVAFSYPISIFWSRYIFQVDYFQNLNFVAVFVILGISADNLFVFIDTWQQSQQHELLNEDTEHRFNNFQARMNFTWKKATKAVSTTSATTAMAFLATGFSTIMGFSKEKPKSQNPTFFFFLISINPAFSIFFFSHSLYSLLFGSL